MQRLPFLWGVGAAVLSAAVVLPAHAQTAEITGVEVIPLEMGLRLDLTTAGGAPQSRIFQTTFGNTQIVDITNAQLTEGAELRQENPVNGIDLVTVEALDINSVRVRVVGAAAAPEVSVDIDRTGFVVGVAGAMVEDQPSGAIATTPESPTQPLELDPTAPAAEVPFPEDETFSEGEGLLIITTAARRPTLEVETPATVEVVTQEELEQLRPLIRTVPDALQTLPGVVVNRLGLLSGSINIRGITGERIGLLVDGERRPNLEFGPDFGAVDPFRVERIEVLQGPASSIYGADAFGGVVNVITRSPDPDQPFTVRSQSYGGGFSEFNSSLELAGPNYVVGATYRTAGDARDANGNIIPPNGTEYTVFDLYGAGRYDIDDQSRLILRFDRYRQDDADLNGFPSPPFLEARNAFRETNRISLAYLNDEVLEDTEVEVRAYYQRSRRQFDNLIGFTIPFPFPTQVTVPGSDLTDTESAGLIATGTSTIGDATLTYGYDFSRDNSEFENLITGVTSPSATRLFHGLFLQSAYDVTDNWIITGGARLDFFNSQSADRGRDDNAVTFNVGTVYEIADGLAARANFAQGFRPPSLLFLFGSSPQGSFFAPTRGQVQSNPNLLSERANNIDIGLDYRTENFLAGVVYFRNDISNFQGFETFTPAGPPIPGPPPPAIRVANKNVLIQGVQFRTAYEFLPGLTLEGNLTFVDSREDTGQPLNQLEVFPTTALVRLTYANDRFLGLLQSRIYGDQGDVILENNQVGPGSQGATVFDLSLGYQVTPAVQFTFTVENLFNTQYVFPTVNFAAPGTRLLFGINAQI